MDKVWSNIDDAVADVFDGATILFGGFGGAGVPYRLIEALLRTDARNLTAVSNHAGDFDEGLAALIAAGRVRKLIASFPNHRNSYHFRERFRRGEVEVEIVPQGIMAERMRAAGAGIAGFYTRVGVGTDVAEGKPTRTFGGETYILWEALRGDFAFIKAHRADPWGNLTYRQAARNFNPVMAMAARVT
ncbi:MAG TPA: 3-oxoacid CoA-transferase subunit A, partial [Bacillota bacterium]